MARSFFFELKTIEKNVINREFEDAKEYSASTVNVAKNLINCIENCSFSKNKVTKFCCKYWRLDAVGMSSLWNSQYGTEKRHTTFLGQISVISLQLRELFGENILDIFVTENKEKLQLISDTIALLEDGDVFLSDLVIPELLSYYSKGSNYEGVCLEDCDEELKAIIKYSRHSVYNYLDSLDERKISYIGDALNRALLDTKTRGINKDKLRVLRMIYNIEPELVNGLDKADVVTEETDVVNDKTDIVETATLGSSDIVMLKTFSSMLNSYSVNGKEVESDKAIKLARALRGMFTPDGFYELLSKYTEDEVYTAIKLIEKSVEN